MQVVCENNIAHYVSILSATLKAAACSVVTAESCTGGLIAAAITDQAGASSNFESGFVTYSDRSKNYLLGVDKQLLAEHGAVSEAVARSMAIGALKNSSAHLAISVTGIAGPEGGSDKKPVGTVHFGFAYRNLLSLNDDEIDGKRKQIDENKCSLGR